MEMARFEGPKSEVQRVERVGFLRGKYIPLPTGLEV